MIGGHVHSYQGPAVFFRLRELHPGDLVHVYTADEAVVSFRVVGWSDTQRGASGRPRIRKGVRATAPPRHVWWEFDEQRKSYRDNVVVYARESVTTSRSYPSSLALALRSDARSLT